MGAGASTALDSAGLSQYRSQFESLDKQELQQLDDAKLQEMGIGNAEQRQKTKRRKRSWQVPIPSPTLHELQAAL